ncbi:MAG: GxxExxY protein [Planctomycetaceae bacterium]
MGKLISENLTEQIIGAAIEVHRELGPGLLESPTKILCYELSRELFHEVELPCNRLTQLWII